MKTAATNRTLEHRVVPESAFDLAKTEREGFLRHFGFRESPFGVTPDPEFLLWTQMHNSALQAIISSIESNLGFSVLLGKPGTGKTSLLFHLLAQYRERARTAFVFQTQCKPRELVRHIVSELDLEIPRRDDVVLHQKLNGMLLEEARAGRKVIIVIDEAQNLQPSSFEAVRLLSDFETGHSKLLHIVFSGSPQLGATLMTPELSQLAQRISTIARLESFSEDEVRDYVSYRLAVVATAPSEGLFSPDSLVEIARRSEGIPRFINVICYRALMLAYLHGQGSVSKGLVVNAADDLNLSEQGSRESGTAPHFREFEAPPRSTSSSSWMLPMTEQPLKPPAQNFAETVPTPGFDANRFAPSPQIPSPARNSMRDLQAQPVPAEATQRGRIKVQSIPLKTGQWHRYRSAGLVAAVLFLAGASWVGWNQLRTRPGTSETAVQSRPGESLRSPAQPSALAILAPGTKDGTNNGVSQNSVQQPNQSAGPSPIKLSANQPSGRGIPQLSDVGPNLLTPSKIPPYPATPANLTSPNTAVSLSIPSDNLAPLVTSGPASSPRLEPEETPTNSKPSASFSLHPVKVIQPEYPARARLSHMEGEVQVELTIDRNGTVRSARALSGNAILAQAAEEAVRQWKYSPYTGDGQLKFPAVTRVQFNFKFNSGTETKK